RRPCSRAGRASPRRPRATIRSRPRAGRSPVTGIVSASSRSPRRSSTTSSTVLPEDRLIPSALDGAVASGYLHGAGVPPPSERAARRRQATDPASRGGTDEGDDAGPESRGRGDRDPRACGGELYLVHDLSPLHLSVPRHDDDARERGGRGQVG